MVFRLKEVAVFALVFVALAAPGCGGGGDAISVPIPTPVETPSRVSGVSHVAVSAVNGAAHLTWGDPTSIPVASVLAYHLYRDNRLVGTVPPQTRDFTDAPASSVPQSVTYEKANEATLVTVTETIPPLTAGSHGYAVTILYQSPNPSGSGVTYHETATGVPYPITL